MTKNGSKYQAFMQKGQNKSFANLNEFEELAEETFYKNPDEFITALAISKDYQQIQTSNGIYLKPTSPFVNINIMDFEYFGYCASVSFEALRTQLGNQKEINQQEENDSNFVAIIWLKV